MCGIMGYIGERSTVDVLLRGLKRLEYRGYDSSGIAYFINNQIEIKKSEGKLSRVQELMSSVPVSTGPGIGHTRWATHGKPTTQNAHPHKTGHVVLVHNGIIENEEELRKELLKEGQKPRSETDSELFGFLVLREMDQGQSLREASRRAMLRIQGANSIVLMSEREPGVIVGIRAGSSLVVTRDDKGGACIASDAQALLEFSQDIYFLNTGTLVEASAKGIQFYQTSDGRKLELKPTRLDWTLEKISKEGFSHFMLKEICEQPQAFIDTLNMILDRSFSERPFHLADQPGVELLNKATQLMIVACGTSYHVALLAKYWMEQLARVPTHVELASEFRYRDPVVTPGTVVIGISQSGETTDTLAVLREMKRRHIPTIGLTNVRGSTLCQEVDAVFFTAAGPEIGVAATKTFLAQMVALFLWAAYLGARSTQIEGKRLRNIFQQLVQMPHLLSQFLTLESEWMNSIKAVAKKHEKARGFFFIGRGFSFPCALEGALKLKEIAYVHAEGYAGGELKHGPIAMIDESMVVVVIAPEDPWREKTLANLQEVKARGAQVIGIGTPQDESLRSYCHSWIDLPVTKHFDSALYPFLVAPAVQLLAYEMAILKGTDVDQPRNLAKSVTVE